MSDERISEMVPMAIFKITLLKIMMNNNKNQNMMIITIIQTSTITVVWIQNA